MIRYKVNLTPDVEVDKTTGNAEVIAQVIDEDGKKADGGDVVFRRRNSADTKVKLDDGAARLTFEKAREDEKQLIRVYAEYTDPRGYTASNSTLVEIPAKQKSDPSDSRSKITLFLDKPIPQIDDNEVVFKAPVTFSGPEGVTNVAHVVEITLDGAVDPAMPRFTTKDAVVKLTLPRTNKKQDYLLGVQAHVGPKVIKSGRAHPIFVPAKETKEEWEFSHLDVDLKGEIQNGDEPDHYNFVLTAKVAKYERQTHDRSKTRPVKSDDAYLVRFLENWSSTLPEVPQTDKNGLAEIVVDKEAGDKSQRMTYIAEVEIEIIDPKAPGGKYKKKFVSNEHHETLPKKTTADKKVEVKKIRVKKSDRIGPDTYVFWVTPLSDPADENSIIKSSLNVTVQSSVPADVPLISPTVNGTAVINYRITKPGAIGSVVFGIEGSGMVSDPPEQVKAKY